MSRRVSTNPTLGSASAVAVVGTPLQALNAAEFLAGHDGDDLVVVALEPSDELPRKQLARTLSMVFPEQHPVVLPFSRMGGLEKYLWLRRFRPHAEVETVVLGAYQLAFNRRLAAIHTGARIVSVDDGSMTPAVVRCRNGTTRSPYLSGDRLPVWRRVAHRMAGLGAADLDAVHFFSIYELDVRVPDSVGRNTYAYTRASLGQGLEPVDERVIVGSSVVDTGLVDRVTYEEVVAAIVAADSSRPVRYRPHRHEDRTRARELCSRLAIPLVDPQLPLELELLASGRTPTLLECTFSTVADTVPLLADPAPTIRVWLPDRSRLTSEARTNVEEMSLRWVNAGFDVIRLGA